MEIVQNISLNTLKILGVLDTGVEVSEMIVLRCPPIIINFILIGLRII